MKTQMFIVFAFLFTLLSCQNVPQKSFDESVERKKILETIDRDFDFLLTANVSLCRKSFECSPDSELNVAHGNATWIKNLMNETDEKILDGYGLNKMRYTKLEHLIEPIIRFSSDGEMAYLACKVKMVYETKDSLGKIKDGQFTNAFLAIFEKKDSCWGEVAISQTFAK